MFFKENSIYKQCLNENPEQRPMIEDLIDELFNISSKQFIIFIYNLANQNIPEAQFYLGEIHYRGEYITRDINKSIHYFTLASNQNIPKAQFTLGLIYYLGEYITRDINKSIHYLSLAANQNNPEAQFILGNKY